MIYGYARISRGTQKIERQIRNLDSYGVDKVYQEAYSSMTTDRKEFKKLLKVAREGDTIVFDSVSRMSRDSVEGTDLYFELESKGIELVFLNEPHINTEAYNKALEMALPTTDNAMIEAILGGIKKALEIKARKDIELAFKQAEKEILDIRKRTSQGLREAKAKGKRVGATKGETYKTAKGEMVKERLKKHHRAFNGSMTDKEFLEAYGGSKTTLVKYKNEVRNEMSK